MPVKAQADYFSSREGVKIGLIMEVLFQTTKKEFSISDISGVAQAWSRMRAGRGRWALLCSTGFVKDSFTGGGLSTPTQTDVHIYLLKQTRLQIGPNPAFKHPYKQPLHDKIFLQPCLRKSLGEFIFLRLYNSLFSTKAPLCFSKSKDNSVARAYDEDLGFSSQLLHRLLVCP